MKNPGMLGKTDASTTRRPSTPRTLKLGVERGLVRLILGPDPAGAAGVMSPGLLLTHSAICVPVGHVGCGMTPLDERAGVHPQMSGEPAGRRGPPGPPLQVIAARVGPLVEVFEVDLRPVNGSFDWRLDIAPLVDRVGLEDRPGKPVVLRLERIRRNPENTLLNAAGKAENEQVGVGPARGTTCG